MAEPAGLDHRQLKRLRTEINSATFFAMSPGGQEPQFVQEAKIKQLLQTEAGAALLLQTLSDNYFAATDQRSTQFRKEQQYAAGLLRVLTLAADITEPKVRALHLSLLAAWLMNRDYDYAKHGQTAKQPYDATLLDRHSEILEQLSTFPAEQSTPRNCATLVDTIARGLIKPGQSEAVPNRAQATLLYTSRVVRERCAEQYLGPDSTVLQRAEYEVDAASQSDPTWGRNALLSSTTLQVLRGDWQKDFPFLFAARQRAHVNPELAHKPISQGLFDVGNPNHREAERIVRKLLLVAKPISIFLEAIKLTALAEGHTVNDLNTYAELIGHPRIKQRLLMTVDPLIREILGESGVLAFHDMCDRMPTGTTPSDKLDIILNSTKSVRPLSTIKLIRAPIQNARRPEWRAVTTWDTTTATTEQLGINLELPETAESAVRHYAAALVTDVHETTTALGETSTAVQFDANGQTWYITSKPAPDKPFPCRSVRIIGDTDMVELTLNERLELEPTLPETHDPTSQQWLEIVRSYVVAAMHDQLNFSHVTSTELATSPQSRPEKQPKKPIRPPHVRRLKNLIVVAHGEQAEHIALTESPNPTQPQDIQLLVDRRPHWQDLAPELTHQAREQVLTDLERDGLLATCNAEQHNLLHRALTGPEAHLLSARRIITELLQRRRQDGSPVLPKNFPTEAILARFRSWHLPAASDTPALTPDTVSNDVTPNTGPVYKTEDDYYFEQLNADDARVQAGEKSTLRLPGILPVMRKDVSTGEPRVYRLSVGQRLAADRLAMAEAGVHYPVPQRQRETQTYVPFHRMAAMPIRDQVTHTKNYTIIRAGSAVEAVTALLQKSTATE